MVHNFSSDGTFLASVQLPINDESLFSCTLVYASVCTLPTSHNHNSFATNTDLRRRHQEEIDDIINGHPSTTADYQLPKKLKKPNTATPTTTTNK